MGTGDVRVFGLVAGTHVLEDIGMDVPHGREVIIPADKAARSKDLYRAIGQKRIFQLPSQPSPQHMAPAGHVHDDVLQERNRFLEHRCKQLEEEKQRLQEENHGLQASLRSALAQHEKDGLNTILQAIQGLKASGTVAASGQAPLPREELADGTAPSYIPSNITPLDAETHIEVRRETGDSDVSMAAERLRRLRRGAG
jgi:hypothetical protein